MCAAIKIVTSSFALVLGSFSYPSFPASENLLDRYPKICRSSNSARSIFSPGSFSGSAGCSSASRLDGSNRRLLLAGVAGHTNGLCSEQISLPFQCVEAFLATCGEDELGAFTGQRTGARLPNTGELERHLHRHRVARGGAMNTGPTRFSIVSRRILSTSA